MIKNQKTFTWIKTALCFLFGLLFILPVLLIVMNALKPNGEILTSFISFPSSLYLDNFAQAMETMNFGVVFKNTVFVTVCTVFLSGTVSFFGAYGISHLKGKASDRFYILFVLGQIIPFHTVMIPISIMATNLYLFKSATNAQWNLLIAGLVVSMVPIIVIYIAGQKYITSGLTAGAIK